MLRAQELIHSFSVLLNFRHVACSWTSKTAYEAASTVFGIESAAPMVYSDFMWICHRDSSSGVMETKHSVAASLQMELISQLQKGHCTYIMNQLQEQQFTQFAILYHTPFSKGGTELQLWTSQTPSFLSARANAQMVVSVNVLIRISAPYTEIMPKVMRILVTLIGNLIFFSVNS